MPEAVDLKFIPAPLTKEELAELIQIPPRNSACSLALKTNPHLDHARRDH
jgi:hypothetical protein